MACCCVHTLWCRAALGGSLAVLVCMYVVAPLFRSSLSTKQFLAAWQVTQLFPRAVVAGRRWLCLCSCLPLQGLGALPLSHGPLQLTQRVMWLDHCLGNVVGVRTSADC